MTPEKLGVKLIPPKTFKGFIEDIPFSSLKKEDDYKVKEFQPIEAICGGCGLEIRMGQRCLPCGKTDCPFGILIL